MIIHYTVAIPFDLHSKLTAKTDFYVIKNEDSWPLSKGLTKYLLTSWRFLMSMDLSAPHVNIFILPSVSVNFTADIDEEWSDNVWSSPYCCSTSKTCTNRSRLVDAKSRGPTTEYSDRSYICCGNSRGQKARQLGLIVSSSYHFYYHHYHIGVLSTSTFIHLSEPS